MRRTLAALALLLALPAFVVIAQAAPKKVKERKPSSVERPPQFVLLAFDGSLNNDFWQESVAFADTVPTNSKLGKMRFTYFVNPPYYVYRDFRSTYTTPGINKKGVSCIGWSDFPETIQPRINYTNNAFLKGHEIGSHANSHCDQSGTDRNNPMYGYPWGEKEWSFEFEQFNKMFFNLGSINKLKPGPKDVQSFSFGTKDIVGFRAPLLAHTQGLWPTLKKFGYRYDTSKTSPPTYWPERHNWGGWNFPLGVIRIAGAEGSRRSTFSMDYNWLCYHSACASKKNLSDAERERFRRQMYDSYMYYFKINYHGGRGPVHIGHHFSKWNRGAYWDAMKDFAKAVCARPEVKCVTYKEYADWLDSLDDRTYQSYRKGEFSKLPDDKKIKDIANPVLAEVRLDSGNGAFEAMVGNPNHARVMGHQVQLQVNFENIGATRITRDELVDRLGRGSSAIVRAALVNREGFAVSTDTYRVEKLGTDEEWISDKPLEDKAVQPEGIEAHTMQE